MMALLPIILFVTTDIYENTTIRIYSSDEKTAVILIYDECNKNASAVVRSFLQTINMFPKTFRFITISFNQTNDIYVKIYETAQFYFF
jgi:hypothetical protein